MIVIPSGARNLLLHQGRTSHDPLKGMEILRFALKHALHFKASLGMADILIPLVSQIELTSL